MLDSTESAVPVASAKCHSCEVKGFTRIFAWILPERKAKFKRYCELNKTTMSEVLNKHINKLVADIDLTDIDADLPVDS